jgi:catechol 2,3-dioxygenase-like lactoylglutathione lyase family enzyme
MNRPLNQPVLELRVALTVEDYEKVVSFYQDALGVDPSAIWTTEATKGILFEMGNATLEIFDEAHAAEVDRIETGDRTSGMLRFALKVPDLEAALVRLAEKGITPTHDPVITPWRDYNARVVSPDGLQITLFQPLDNEDN